jgi:hypothetical protein
MYTHAIVTGKPTDWWTHAVPWDVSCSQQPDIANRHHVGSLLTNPRNVPSAKELRADGNTIDTSGYSDIDTQRADQTPGERHRQGIDRDGRGLLVAAGQSDSARLWVDLPINNCGIPDRSDRVRCNGFSPTLSG